MLAVLAVLGGLGLLSVAAAGGWWHSQGGRWYVVTSPSMGQELPMGTLLLTRPTSVSQVADGEVITFHSPGSRTVFTHRVVARDGEGLTTRGDVNQADDAWTITDADLVGKVVWHAPALGWALRAGPLLALGLVTTWLATLLVGVSRRPGLRQLGVSVTVSVVSWWLHPWVGIVRLSQSTPDDGSRGAVMEVISTGLLPVRAFEVDGPAVALSNGEVGTLELTRLTRGRYDVGASLDLPWWGWAVVVLVVLSPLLWSLLVGPPASGESNQVAAHHVTQEDSEQTGDPATVAGDDTSRARVGVAR